MTHTYTNLMVDRLNIEEQKTFYNERWGEFEFANRLKLMRCTAILRAMAASGLYQPKIIDLGSGTGWLAGIIGNFGPTTGVELSNTAVIEASRKYPHVQFMDEDILQWDYPKETFDIVVSQEDIEHIEVQKAYLDVAHGLLRPKGYLILTTPNARTFEAMPKHQREAWSNQPIENWLTVAELRDLLQHRFEVVRLTTIIPNHGILGVYRFVNSVWLKALFQRLRLGNSFDSLRLNLGYGLHTLAVARKK